LGRKGLCNGAWQLNLGGIDQVEVLVRQHVGEVGAEEVELEEERCLTPSEIVSVGLEHLDSTGRQVVFERCLNWLVQARGEQVSRPAVGEGPADAVTDLVRRQTVLGKMIEVVLRFDGVVPGRAGQVRTVEADITGLLLRPGVPLPYQSGVVAMPAQRVDEGKSVLVQILEIPDIPLAVGKHTMPKRRLAGEQTDAGGGADCGGRVPAVKSGTCAGEIVKHGGDPTTVAVGTESIDPVLVGHQEEDIGPLSIGHAGLLRSRGTEGLVWLPG